MKALSLFCIITNLDFKSPIPTLTSPPAQPLCPATAISSTFIWSGQDHFVNYAAKSFHWSVSHLM